MGDTEPRTVLKLWITAMEELMAIGGLDAGAVPLETAKLFVHGDSLEPITDAERAEARRLVASGFIEVRPHTQRTRVAWCSSITGAARFRSPEPVAEESRSTYG